MRFKPSIPSLPCPTCPRRLCWPHRFARALNRLGQATGAFVPVAPLLLEVLQWGDLSRPPKPSPGQHPDLLLQLRAGKTQLRSAAFQEEVINQVRQGFSSGLVKETERVSHQDGALPGK